MLVTDKANNKIVTRTALSLCVGLGLMSSQSALAEQITFIGKVKTELPKVTVTNSQDPVSDVKRFTLSVSPSAGICSIDANEQSASRHGSVPVCLITWDDPKGLDAYLRGLRGVVKGSGEHTFTYTLSMFDKDKFDVITQEQYSVTFQEPMVPDLPSLTSTWRIKPENTELEHDIYNRNESNRSVFFDASIRNYDQKIEFGDFSCVIPQGQRTCSIAVNANFLEKEVQGQEELAFRATDTFGHFDNEKSSFKYVWDFRPPIIEGIHVNASEDRLPQVLTEYGQTLVLMHDQAAVIIKSPHTNIEDDWWLPTDPTLSITPNRVLNITNTLNVNNVNVLFNIGSTSQSSYLASPIARPFMMGEYLAYVYDFSEINDGLYNFQFSTLDKNGNGELKSLEDIYVDRYPPDIQFVVNERQHRSRSPAYVYAISDITVAAWGGWEDGSEITSAMINEEPIDFAGGTDLVKRLKDIDLPLNSLNTLTVVAKDKTGNKVTNSLDFRYGMYEFSTYSSPAMASVQETHLYLESRKGASCVPATSDLLAQLYSQTSKGLRRGCTFEWIEKPNGLTTDSMASLSQKRIRLASGIITTAGDHPYSFKVHQHDAYGTSKEIYLASGVINIAPLEAPTLRVGREHIAKNFPEDYKYALPLDRRLNIPAFVTHVRNSEIIVELRNSEGTVLDTREINAIRSSTNLVFTTTSNYPPLSEQNYKVRAYYRVNPSLFEEKPYHFFVTPPTMMRLSLSHPRSAVQGSLIPITAQVGLHSQEGFNYAPSMGEWDIYLAKLDTNNQLVEITEKFQTDINGVVNLSLSADELVSASNRVFAFAKLKTDYPEIDFSLRASSLFTIPVLTTGSLSAQLTTSQISNPVPANFLIRLNFETQADRLSADNITWQESADGNDWQTIGRSLNNETMFFNLPSAQEKYVRVAIRHKLSDSLVYTNVIKLTAFNEALIKLTGDSRVIPGAVGRFAFELNQYAIDTSSEPVEWSIDKGASWSPMAPTDEAVITEPTDITARLRIQPEGQEPYFIQDTVSVTTIDPIPLYPRIFASKSRAEIGDDIQITASFPSASNDFIEQLRYNFVTPSGEVLNQLQLQKILTENDFSNGRSVFLFRTWIDGYQMQTLTTRTIPITQLFYTFPETAVVINTRDRVINSDINVLFRKPRRSLLPTRVEISQELILPPELSVVRSTGFSAVLVASKPGLYPFTVRFYDNRGNEREHVEFIEAHAPPDMIVNLRADLQGKYLRPPIRLVSRFSAKPGMSRDKLKTIEWKLNDQIISDDELKTSIREIVNEPGDYVLALKVETEFGQISENTFDFSLAPNKPPYCEPFWEDRDRTLTLNINCNDDDGRIVRVDATYYIDDENQRTTTRYSLHQITFVKGSQPTNRPIEVIAIDDSFSEVTLTVPWPNL